MTESGGWEVVEETPTDRRTIPHPSDVIVQLIEATIKYRQSYIDNGGNFLKSQSPWSIKKEWATITISLPRRSGHTAAMQMLMDKYQHSVAFVMNTRELDRIKHLGPRYAGDTRYHVVSQHKSQFYPNGRFSPCELVIIDVASQVDAGVIDIIQEFFLGLNPHTIFVLLG